MAKDIRRGGDGLTPQQRTYAKTMAATGDATYAATKAGYAQPDVIGYQLKRHAGVKASVQAYQRKLLMEEGLPVAVRTLIAIAENEAKKDADRVSASKVIMQYTLGVAQAGQDKAPEDMTAEELASRIALLRARQAQIADEAQVIEGTVADQSEDDVFG